MMETPRGDAERRRRSPRRIRGSRGSCSAPTTSSRSSGAAHTPDRLPLVASLGLCLLAARAEGLVCVDGVYNAFQDQEGLRAACVQGRDMGFDGKTLIHPDQIAVANEVFAPSPEDLALARRAGRGLRGGRGARRGRGGGRRADRREPARGDGAAAAGARGGDRRRWRRRDDAARPRPRRSGPSRTSSSARRRRARAVSTRRWAPGRRAGVMAAADPRSASVLMVVGFRRAPFVPVYDPPAWGIHLNNLLMLGAVVLMGAGHSKGRRAALAAPSDADGGGRLGGRRICW